MVCFILSECFRSTTTSLSHQQLVLDPRLSKKRSFWDTFDFSSLSKTTFDHSKVTIFSIWTIQCKNQLDQRKECETRATLKFYCWPCAAHATKGRKQMMFTRDIFEQSSRATPLSWAATTQVESLLEPKSIFLIIFSDQPQWIDHCLELNLLVVWPISDLFSTK